MEKNRDRVKHSAEEKNAAHRKFRILYKGNLILYVWFLELVKEKGLSWKLSI